MSTVVWVNPSATSFSCLCEECLEGARTTGLLFSDALMRATVRGEIAAEADVSTRMCRAGHQIVLRRVSRPASLPQHDERQLALS